MKNKICAIVLFLIIAILAIGFGLKIHNDKVLSGPDKIKHTENDVFTLFIAAASSMQPSLERIHTLFQEEYPNITIESTYDSSGKLQTQLEEGMEADVFLSAGMKQMNVLKDTNRIEEDSVIELLENQIVLIASSGIESKVSGFVDILNADNIAMGDPASVPAGQYTKEIFEYLGIYEKVLEKASLGSNVSEVLNWVGEGSADVGIVYATDAATTDKVIVIGYAPKDSLKQAVIYPVGVLNDSKYKKEADLYITFLQSTIGKTIFKEYGFMTR